MVGGMPGRSPPGYTIESLKTARLHLHGREFSAERTVNVNRSSFREGAGQFLRLTDCEAFDVASRGGDTCCAFLSLRSSPKVGCS